MSRAQEVSLARLLRVYESKIASSSGRRAVPDANGTPSTRAAGDGAPGLGAYTDGVVDADASTRRAPSSQDRGAFLVDRRDDDADAEGVDSHPETVALKRRQHVDGRHVDEAAGGEALEQRRVGAAGGEAVPSSESILCRV